VTPKVYIETSIPSYLTARRSQDVRALANQETTIEWWDTRRAHFDLFISEFVLAEVALGRALIAEGPIPERAAIDSFHIAIAAVNGMEYLLTWNCTHIANAVMRAKIETVCRRHGYEPPVICTPQELMEE
jgi:hypothetical protein